MDEQRNLILAVAIALGIWVAWNAFVAAPIAKREAAERAAHQPVAASTGPGAPAAPPPAQPKTRDEALAAEARVGVDSPEIAGSIDLTGARIDDVSLKNYTREVDPNSGKVTLLNPAGGPDAYYSYLGWSGEGLPEAELPGPTTAWRLVSGKSLTPETPIMLEYDSPGGLKFERKISIDQHFMFTVDDRVTNGTGKPLTLRPYATVVRFMTPDDLTAAKRLSQVHQGPVGMFDNSRQGQTYEKIQKAREFHGRSTGGWFGITDRYWLTAVIPDPKSTLDGQFKADPRDRATEFQASFVRDPVTIADGQWGDVKNYVFAGAKRAEILRDYSAQLGINRLVDSIDWGNFWFLTKPFFLVLDYFYQLVGNFGVAILMLVVVLKIVTFPLINMSFKSAARMRLLQPKLKEIQERFKGDPERLQKEMAGLWQREKVNPFAGCLPALAQIPIFWSLYKTLFVTIEMRHAPFFGWIHDLSAPDTSNIWNLFGLLGFFDPAHVPFLGAFIGGTGFFAIGLLPILYGLTMAATQTLSPTQPDPTQQKVIAFMPWIFMFFLSKLAVGLLIYYVWNNTLSFAQQYVIMRRQGVETPIGTFISKRYHRLRARFANGGQ
jgi:YidC/Oxa1 family membrane protein insertase